MDFRTPELLKLLAPLVDPRQQISDAYWSITHPRDRVMGRGRASQQQLAFPLGGRWGARTPGLSAETLQKGDEFRSYSGDMDVRGKHERAYNLIDDETGNIVASANLENRRRVTPEQYSAVTGNFSKGEASHKAYVPSMWVDPGWRDSTAMFDLYRLLSHQGKIDLDASYANSDLQHIAQRKMAREKGGLDPGSKLLKRRARKGKAKLSPEARQRLRIQESGRLSVQDMPNGLSLVRDARSGLTQVFETASGAPRSGINMFDNLDEAREVQARRQRYEAGDADDVVVRDLPETEDFRPRSSPFDMSLSDFPVAPVPPLERAVLRSTVLREVNAAGQGAKQVTNRDVPSMRRMAPVQRHPASRPPVHPLVRQGQEEARAISMRQALVRARLAQLDRVR